MWRLPISSDFLTESARLQEVLFFLSLRAHPRERQTVDWRYSVYRAFQSVPEELPPQPSGLQVAPAARGAAPPGRAALKAPAAARPYSPWPGPPAPLRLPRARRAEAPGRTPGAGPAGAGWRQGTAPCTSRLSGSPACSFTRQSP